jgi:hypothetical protein
MFKSNFYNFFYSNTAFIFFNAFENLNLLQNVDLNSYFFYENKGVQCCNNFLQSDVKLFFTKINLCFMQSYLSLYYNIFVYFYLNINNKFF